MSSYWVYILCSKRNGTLYVGVTKDLSRRVYEHKLVDGFTKKYDVNKLVHVESFNDINEAIYREKCIKKWNRAWKLRLIEERNPDWQGKTTSLRIAVKKTSKNNQNFSICHLLNVGLKPWNFNYSYHCAQF